MENKDIVNRFFIDTQGQENRNTSRNFKNTIRSGSLDPSSPVPSSFKFSLFSYGFFCMFFVLYL